VDFSTFNSKDFDRLEKAIRKELARQIDENFQEIDTQLITHAVFGELMNIEGEERVKRALEQEQKEIAMEEHYVYGAGRFGCLYDMGPYLAASKGEAVDTILDWFSDLPDIELQEMRKNLASIEFHSFTDKDTAGVDYVELVRQSGPMPEEK
jgi:hypothetical protein